jgi:uroporphyrinogen-III decarboxylase
MVKMIKDHGGFVRIHSHGCIRNVLDYIVNMGTDAIDPIEPPPYGDVELGDIRKKYGKRLALFGNIEVTDIENMPEQMFRKVVKKTIADGICGEGRGFVLMPSASPYGRNISKLTLRNYQIMIEEVESVRV